MPSYFIFNHYSQPLTTTLKSLFGNRLIPGCTGYLVNSQQLVEKLAESRLMRRLAQFTVYGFNKAKEISHDAIEQASESETLKKLEERSDTDTKLGSFTKTFAKELRKGAKEMNDELKKRELKD